MKITSKIATIVYKNYEENVDMLNPLFKQSELDTLVASDKDIIRVDYYINGKYVGAKMHTAKQAIAQVVKMEITQGNIYREKEMDLEIGSDWFASRARNKKRDIKITELENRQSFYKQFIDKESFENSDLPNITCCEWNDFKHELYY